MSILRFSGVTTPVTKALRQGLSGDDVKIKAFCLATGARPEDVEIVEETRGNYIVRRPQLRARGK